MVKRRHKRTRARHFGDNPHIRRSHREAKLVNREEPWELAYIKVKRLRSKKKYTVKRRHRKHKRKTGYFGI